MKKSKIFLAVFALLGMFYNGQAQNVKEVKDSIDRDGNVRKTIKMEVNSVEDLQNQYAVFCSNPCWYLPYILYSLCSF